ncbi:MAG: hypothetical protein IH608_13210 [Proteobacteria bacterium]|nr:hypothetical protein [Pseudomonadota bacterium]
MAAHRWGLVAGLLAASVAQADGIRQERFHYRSGLARFLVSEHTWVVCPEGVEVFRSPAAPPVPLLAVRVGGAERPPQGEGLATEGEGSPAARGEEARGTKTLCPGPANPDADTQDAEIILEESP